MSILGSLGGAFGFGSNDSGGASAIPAIITASSGNQTPSSGLNPGNGWTYHTFVSPGSFSVTREGIAQVFLVGSGGGGSGHAASGGGGAGGIAYNRQIVLPTGTYNVTVGQEPAAGPGAGTSYNGNASRVYNSPTTIDFNAAGGGRGGSYSAGEAGGSGGGNAGYPPSINSLAGQLTNQFSRTNPPYTWKFGNPGGRRNADSPTDYHAGSGGGGAGQRGYNSPGATVQGEGGDGIYLRQFRGPLIGLPGINPYDGGFGGGGGAGGWSGESGGAVNGEGGGRGYPSYSSPSNPGGDPGVDYLGGGGGGGNGPTSPGGRGGKGLVVIRYPIENNSVTIGGNGSSSSSPIRFASDMSKISTSGTYWFHTRSMGDARQFYVDTSTNGGPWIRIWLAASDYNQYKYDWDNQDVPGIIMDSGRFMYCFCNPNDNSVTQPWSWWFTNVNSEPNVGAFCAKPPYAHGGYAEPYITQINATRLADNTNYNGYYLRTGFSSFGSQCDEGRSGVWGQLCLKNSTSSAVGTGGAGLSDFPHVTGYATTASDYCAQSNQTYTATNCSSTRRFAIYVKLTDVDITP